ncbi:MAG: 50S ribosomal protein L23 [Nanoarchaeota archaeon]|nr:50S ribosomal protein L23 [Nanoarchaeota archaeon]
MAKKVQSNEEKLFQEELSKQFYDVVKSVIMTEKATRLTEFENKLTFEVAKQATKPLVKVLIENEYKKSVKSVNMINDHNGKKRAIVTFKDENVASDLSAELGGN